MIEFIKGTGKMIINMEMGLKCFLMELSIRGNISMVNLKELESTCGRTDSFMKENG